MARIKNKDIYPIKPTPNNNDYVVGTDNEDNGKTVSFRLGSLLAQTGAEGNFVPKGGFEGTGQDLIVSLGTKVDKNTAIIGGTYTKISFDNKGLITGGVNATTADINDSANRRYVTDADLVDIGNLSGVNSGDQTSIVGITGTKAQFNTSLTDGDFVFAADITESAQDAVGTILTDTSTIDFTYDDLTPTISAIVKPNSITATELSNTINISEFVNNANYATSAYVDGLVVGLLDDRGSYNASVNVFPSTGGSGTAGAILKGDIWYVSVMGTLGGQVVNVGDSFRALVDSPAQITTNWSILEANIGYVPENVANKSTNISLGTSNILYPTENAVKTYADAKITQTITNGVVTTAPSEDAVFDALATKQPTLVSGSNIKTVNQLSLLGSGDINPATSTAVISGCTIVNNGTTFSVTSGVAEIVTNTYPLTRQTINFTGVTLVTPLYPRTLLYIDNTGTLQQFNGSAGDLTPSQKRNNIVLGLLATFGGTIIAIQNTPNLNYGIDGRFSDLSEALGVINVSGNIIGANGINLQFNKGAGLTFRIAGNYFIDRKVPDVTTDVALTPVPAGVNLIGYRNGIGGWTYEAYTGFITPNFWDNGTGVKATVANNKFTTQRIYFFNGTDTFVIYLGQIEYASMDSAVANVNNANRVIDPATSLASLRSSLIVKKGVTALNNTAEAMFLDGPKINGGASGSAISSQNFQGVYDNSVTPQVTTTTALGSVDFKRGSTADTDNVFRVLNGAGTETFTAKGNGAISALTYNGFNPTTDLRAINTTSPLLGGGNLTADRTLSIQLATTAQNGYLSSTDWNTFNNKAPLASPTFTGIPTAPTAGLGTNTTQLATTAFVFANAQPLIPHLGYDNTKQTLWNYGKGGIATNSSFGNEALSVNTTGFENVAYGLYSLGTNTTGNGNVAFGNRAGNQSNSPDVGGFQNQFSTNSVFIGNWTSAKNNNTANTNEIVIGDRTLGAGSNTATLGNTSIITTRLRGSVLGGSFVKDGGTASQFLKADGSSDSNSYALSSGSANYIQNQNASAQTANMWISGTGQFGSDVSLNGGAGARTLNIQTNTSGNPVINLTAAGVDGGSIFYNRATSELTFSNSAVVGALKIANTGAATFSSTVTASNGTLIGGTGTTNYIPKWTGTGTQGNSAWQESATGGRFFDGTDDGVNKLQVNGSGIFTKTGVQSTFIGSDQGAIDLKRGSTQGFRLFSDLNSFGIYDLINNATRLEISNSAGVVKINNLSGTGTRTVVADASGNLITESISTQTANYTTTLSDGTVLVDATAGNITITLLVAVGNSNKKFTVKKIDSTANTVTVSNAAGIDGTTTKVYSTQDSGGSFQSNGTKYFIIGNF